MQVELCGVNSARFNPHCTANTSRNPSSSACVHASRAARAPPLLMGICSAFARTSSSQRPMSHRQSASRKPRATKPSGARTRIARPLSHWRAARAPWRRPRRRRRRRRLDRLADGRLVGEHAAVNLWPHSERAPSSINSSRLMRSGCQCERYGYAIARSSATPRGASSRAWYAIRSVVHETLSLPLEWWHGWSEMNALSVPPAQPPPSHTAARSRSSWIKTRSACVFLSRFLKRATSLAAPAASVSRAMITVCRPSHSRGWRRQRRQPASRVSRTWKRRRKIRRAAEQRAARRRVGVERARAVAVGGRSPRAAALAAAAVAAFATAPPRRFRQRRGRPPRPPPRPAPKEEPRAIDRPPPNRRRLASEARVRHFAFGRAQ